MRFAVYGTLKRNHGNHGYLGSAKFLGVIHTDPVYTLWDGPYPIVTRGGSTSIECEVYQTDNEEEISDVFRLEGCKREQDAPGTWYTYDKITTPYGEANIFVMNEGKSGRKISIESGVWGSTRANV